MEKMKAFQNAILETLHYLFCAKKGLTFKKKKNVTERTTFLLHYTNCMTRARWHSAAQVITTSYRHWCIKQCPRASTTVFCITCKNTARNQANASQRCGISF